MRCSICGSQLARSKKTECAGQGDFYNIFKVKCLTCSIEVSCDDYMCSPKPDEQHFSYLERDYQTVTDVIKIRLKSRNELT